MPVLICVLYCILYLLVLDLSYSTCLVLYCLLIKCYLMPYVNITSCDSHYIVTMIRMCCIQLPYMYCCIGSSPAGVYLNVYYINFSYHLGYL